MPVATASDAKPAAPPSGTKAGPRTAAPQSGFAPWKDPAKSPIVRFENVTKKFDEFVAVKNVTLDIYEREFSRCSDPRVAERARYCGCWPALSARRKAASSSPATTSRSCRRASGPLNMMFQSYALFPHMTVEGNIGFGLRQEGMEKARMAERVEEAMAMLSFARLPNANRISSQAASSSASRLRAPSRRNRTSFCSTNRSARSTRSSVSRRSSS